MPAFARTTAFRLTLLSAGLFALSSFVILALVYAATAGAAVRRADAAIAEEIAAVEKRVTEDGIGAANRYIVRRSVAGGEFLYLLIGPDDRRISGNISDLPAAPADAEGRVRFEYDRAPVDDAETPEAGRDARGRIAPLGEGYRIFVGLDVEEESRFIANILNAVLIASGVALALGIVSGAVVSRRFARRLEMINAAARKVRAGQLQTRAPRTHSGDELDHLAANFNEMMDRVEHLMHRMRNAGDSIAHDLRLPLTRMRGRLEAALAEAGDLAEREAALGQAISDIDELMKTFNAVLSLSRLQTGERRRAFETLDPAAVLADIAELYEPVCEDAGLDFSFEAEAGLSLLGDRELIAQAVSNLVDNAVKYTPEDGAVALRARRCASGEVEISVTDTGPGVPAGERERVLERFVRLEKSRSQPGVGLGLSLVHAIAEVHGARLSLDDGPGEVDGSGPGLRVALVFPEAR
ncbi:two-component sensor histidine kinase [Marinicauda salina]|uniref:histidine kinase n=1 Tax=Marinicauda salina TaxID=2135793 RepID=A0A2U2BT09_9PROT|nr:two-component sensor histidine kinase [Marinicauda salina]